MNIKVGKLYKVVPFNLINGGVYVFDNKPIGFIPTNSLVIVVGTAADSFFFMVLHEEKIYVIESCFLKEL
jgi:hypothetical protein